MGVELATAAGGLSLVPGPNLVYKHLVSPLPGRTDGVDVSCEPRAAGDGAGAARVWR